MSTQFRSNLLISVISAVVGAGLGAAVSLYIDKGTTAQSEELYTETRRQTNELYMQSTILKDGFENLITILKNDQSDYRDISVTINNLQTNINSIRKISNDLNNQFGEESSTPDVGRTVKVKVGSDKAEYIDSKSTISVIEDNEEKKFIRTMLNGVPTRFYVGTVNKFEDMNKQRCKIAYMGKQEGHFIFSINCPTQ